MASFGGARRYARPNSSTTSWNRATGEAPGQAGVRLRELPDGSTNAAGHEVMAMVRKGQVRGIGGRDMQGQAVLISELFQAAA
jgi:hypothetical protein